MAHDHRLTEAGRRMKAALISYQLGLASVDYKLKQMPEDPGEGWAELAEILLRLMSERKPITVLLPSDSSKIQ